MSTPFFLLIFHSHIWNYVMQKRREDLFFAMVKFLSMWQRVFIQLICVRHPQRFYYELPEVQKESSSKDHSSSSQNKPTSTWNSTVRRKIHVDDLGSNLTRVRRPTFHYPDQHHHGLSGVQFEVDSLTNFFFFFYSTIVLNDMRTKKRRESRLRFSPIGSNFKDRRWSVVEIGIIS